MDKYARYISWLAKVVVAIAAVAAFAKYLMTFDSVYSAMSAANIAVLTVLVIEDRLLKLEKRVADMERQQRVFDVCVRTLAAEQFDRKAKVNSRIRTHGDE